MIKISLTNEQFNVITLALTSSDNIHSEDFEDSGLTEDEQKLYTSAFKKFGQYDLMEDN